MKHSIAIVTITVLVISGCATTPDDRVTSDARDGSESEYTSDTPVEEDASAKRAQSDVPDESAAPEANDQTSDAQAVAAAEQGKSEAAASAESAEDVEEARPPVFRPVLVERLLPNGVVDSVTKISYDESGRVSLKVTGPPGSAPDERIEYLYPSPDRIEVVRLSGDGVVRSRLNRLFDNGLLVREEQLDSFGSVELVSEYDIFEGEVGEWRLFDGTGELLSRSVYAYSDGQVTRIDNYDADQTLQEYVTYTYEPGTVLIDAFDAIEQNSVSHTERRVASDGRLTTQLQSGLGMNRTVEYAYDQVGNLDSEAVYDRSMRLLYITRFTYEASDVGEGRL